MINYVVPLVAVAAGHLVLGEHVETRAIAALAIILVGLAIGEGRPRRPAPGG